jgi:hypothetical protein
VFNFRSSYGSNLLLIFKTCFDGWLAVGWLDDWAGWLAGWMTWLDDWAG